MPHAQAATKKRKPAASATTNDFDARNATGWKVATTPTPLIRRATSEFDGLLAWAIPEPLLNVGLEYAKNSFVTLN